MNSVLWLKRLLEYLGGEDDERPKGLPVGLRSPLWGVWWGLLACAIIAFCGQSSKFIYIDF